MQHNAQPTCALLSSFLRVLFPTDVSFSQLGIILNAAAQPSARAKEITLIPSKWAEKPSWIKAIPFANCGVSLGLHVPHREISPPPSSCRAVNDLQDDVGTKGLSKGHCWEAPDTRSSGAKW